MNHPKIGTEDDKTSSCLAWRNAETAPAMAQSGHPAFGEAGLDWQYTPSGAYRCDVRLTCDPDGELTAYVPQLPGVVSQGATEQDALQNIIEALTGAVSLYLDSGDPIPWREAEPPSPGEIRKWIVVRV